MDKGDGEWLTDDEVREYYPIEVFKLEWESRWECKDAYKQEHGVELWLEK